MTDAQGQPESGPGSAPEMSAEEAELQAAYEEQLRRITATELLLQAAASMLNLGARRMGLGEAGAADRDLEQVRDAIDGVRALMPVIERRTPAVQIRPLRDALSHLQVAYARELQAPGAQPGGSDGPAPRDAGDAHETQADAEGDGGAAAEGSGEPEGDGEGSGEAGSSAPQQPGEPRRRGPAESSGRLWVPGKD